MDTESEMIRQQMDETRTALTDKLEVLEHQVVDTVQSASSAVAETVENVKDIVRDSVETVKESVQETLGTVKDAFDLKRQVDRRPWTMLAGATTLGFFGGYLLRGSRVRQAREDGKDACMARANGSRTVARNGVPEDHRCMASDANKGNDTASTSAPEEPSLLANLGDTFQAEISQLKGLAVGALLGIVRDAVTKNVPESMGRQVEDAIDGITVKLGGQPIRGRLVPERVGRAETPLLVPVPAAQATLVREAWETGANSCTDDRLNGFDEFKRESFR